ncbi:MAG: hypothetical protein HY782_25065 [Chloroflexi bacterium]|nr:hypothetical protein [Chloroflexota bacterium]
MTLDSELASAIRLQGRALAAVRAVWAAVFFLAVAVLVLALPARYAQLVSPEDEVREGLTRLGFSPQYIEQYGSEAAMSAVVSQLGLSPASYAAYQLTLEVVVALVYVAIALIIYRRKSDSPIGLFASLFLVTFGIGGSSYVLTPLMVQHSAGFFLTGSVTTLAYSMLPLFFYLFPDGRLVPRWAWIPAGLWAVSTFFWNFAPRSPLNPTYWPLWLYSLYLLLVWGSALFAQVYRYRRVSSLAQRQQTKWLVFGFGLMVLLLLPPFFLLPILLPSAESEAFYSILMPVQTLAMSIIPIALAISILRYRLWDIDILIRRTLIYAVLTASLAFVYFGSVVLLQQLLRAVTGQASELAIIVSTLAIAALFNPLRKRVQDTIDSRFYRKKYDAARVLAEFAATARDEVELNRLNEQLVHVVNETMQPTSVSLWLRKTDDRRGRVEE